MPVTQVRTVRGIEIFERRVGSGPPTVVLHGGPGAHHDYLLPGFDALGTGRTLVYYDQRGGGKSPVSYETPVGWTEHVADLEALRELWGIDVLSLAGYSWGGLLSILYAIHHPERVGSLALVSSAPLWKEGRERFERRFAERSQAEPIPGWRAQLMASGLKESDPERYRKRLFELSVAGYFHDPTQAANLTPFRITGRTQQAVWESLGAYDLREAVSALSVPAVVVHGEDDPLPIDTAEVAAELLGCRLIRIPRCGHVPYVEAPAQFREALDAFLPREGR